MSDLNTGDASVPEEVLMQNREFVLAKLREARENLEREANAKVDDTEGNRFGQERAKIHFYYLDYEVDGYEGADPGTFGRPELILDAVLGYKQESGILKGDRNIRQFEHGVADAFDTANQVKRLFSVGGKYHRVPLQHFDGMEPWHQDDIYAQGSVSARKLVSHQINPGFLRNPKVDVRIMLPIDKQGREYTHAFHRFRSLNDQEKRAFAKRAEQMFEITTSEVNIHTGKSSTFRLVTLYQPNYSNVEWEFVMPDVKDPKINRDPIARAEMQSFCWARVGIAWAQEQSWQVYLKETDEEDRIGLTLQTDPEGAKAVFRLRDLGPGENRRKALVHWVRGHSRRKSLANADQALTLVRQHLRGELEFSWRGFDCRIVPSFADQEAARRALGIAQPTTWIKTISPQADLLTAMPGSDWIFV